MYEIRKILCPMDFSDTSLRALRTAVGLAERLGSSLTLLHVVEPAPSVGAAPPVEAYIATPGLTYGSAVEYERQTREEAQKQMNILIEGHVPKSLGVTVAVEIGDDARRIVNYADEGDFELIVMGTHGRTGIKRVLLGSVAEKVVRHAHCPVMTIPPRDPRTGVDRARA